MKKLFIILISTLIVSACSDSFLQTENHNNLDGSVFLKTSTDLQLAVNSAYTPLEGAGMFGLGYFKLFNSLDPYIWFEGQSSYDKFNFSPTSKDIIGTWMELYRGLFRTSDILAKMGDLKSVVDSATYYQSEGQLKALRGMYYFYLVTWYNTPVYYDETDVPTDVLIGYKNGTQEQFWNKLEEDLSFAASNLPVSWGSSDIGRITKGAANAQLGKALLYKHYHYYMRLGLGNTPEAKANLLKAKQALSKVMDGTYHLIQPQAQTKADYQAALLSTFSYIDIPVGTHSYTAENNAESIWEVQFNDNPGIMQSLPGWLDGGNELYLYFSPNPNGYRNQVIDPSLLNEFESASSNLQLIGYSQDPRATANCYLDGDTLDWRPESGFHYPFSGGGLNGKGDSYTKSDGTPLYAGLSTKGIGLKKYYYPQFVEKNGNNAACPNNVRVIRYADVLLMYAEACFQYDGDATGDGLIALNSVRARAGMSPIGTLNPAAIVHERNVELATEGHRYNDIVRWSYDPSFGINLGTLFQGYFDVNKNHYLPIPQDEINANHGVLKQNPGW